MARETFTPEQEQEICRLYVEEHWFKKNIADYFQCSQYRINNVLKKHDIPTFTRRVNFNFKEDFFENIDTEEKAYILGFLYTDGSIAMRNGVPDSIRLELQIKDIDTLNQIKETLGIDSKLTFSKHKNKSGSITESALMTIRSKKMAEDLSKYGIVHNKTYKTTHLPEINDDVLRHFLRGLIDGDGSIYINHSYSQKAQKYYDKNVIYFCNYFESVCEDFRQIMKKVLNKEDLPPVSKEKGTYRFTLTKQEDVRKVAAFLYKDNNICLARKYELAKNIFEDNNGEDIVYPDH